MGRVLVTHRLPEGGTDPLVAAGHSIADGFGDAACSAQELSAVADDYDAIICLLTDPIDESVLKAGSKGRLKAVGNVAVGYNNIDVAAADWLGIAVCNTPGVLDQTTADLAFLLILAASRLASEAERDLRAGRWSGWGINQYLGREVHGSVLGLLGFGRIGQAVARRADGFGMEVLHHARRRPSADGTAAASRYVEDLDELMRISDIVSVHVPLTAETTHLIGAQQLELLGPNGVLVNTSRGPVVDEAALARSLHENQIFAAGIDVYEHEPEMHPELLTAPRTVLLPHIGSATRETRTRMARLACEGVCDILAGRQPENLVRWRG
ncbi:MAG: D-glycerate dehydrogenase [Acidimicrobiales bacterium]